MARIARVVARGLPHHITQRGNRRQATFFNNDDYKAYLKIMAEWCCRCGVDIWAYCLMPNHVHLIAVPSSEEGLRQAIGEAHRRYTRRVNFREGWRGHLWQGRFASYIMDEAYLLVSTRYVEFNPVRAGLVEKPEEYQWSSAAAHMSGRDDALVKVLPLLDMVGNWRDFLSENVEEHEMTKIRRHENTGRPLGSDNFINNLEKTLNCILRRQKPGPKCKVNKR